MEGVRRSCKKCNAVFATFESYMFHVVKCKKKLKAEKKLQCAECGKGFTRKFGLRRHLESMHANVLGAGSGTVGRLFACGICKISFPSRADMKAHRQAVHERATTQFRTVQTAHRRAIAVSRLDYPDNIGDVTTAFQYSHDHLCHHLEKEAAKNGGFFKFGLVLTIEFIQVDENNLVSQSIVVPFRSKVITAKPMQQLDQELTDAYELIQNSVLSFIEKGSGWIIDDIMHMDIEVSRCLDLSGCCYSSHIISWSQSSGYIIDNQGFHPSHSGASVKMDDRFGRDDGNMDCFYIALARHFRRDTTSRHDLLRYACDNFKGVELTNKPVSLKDIDDFEKLNEDIAINVIFLDEDNRILPARASARIEAKHQVVLLLTFIEPNVEAKPEEWVSSDMQKYMHYICVEEPSEFLAKRGRTSARATKVKNFVCFNCFNGHGSLKTLQNHRLWCFKMNHQRLIYPEQGEKVKFNPGIKSSKAPFVMFFDFESLQKPISKECSCTDAIRAYTNANDETRMAMEHDNSLRQSLEHARPVPLRICQHKTKAVHVQVPFAYHIIAVSRDGEVVETREYIGEDAGSKFCDDMLDLDEILTNRLKTKLPLALTKAQQREFEDAEQCYLCEKEFGDDALRQPVRDHDHLTGEYLGAAHNLCNLRRREQSKILAFSHNFSGYDSHLFVKELSKKIGRINHCAALPLNSQKFRTLEVNNTMFLDSCAFLGDSLAKLTTTLKASNHSFDILSKWQPEEERRELLTRKGVYPYSFATSIEKLVSQEKLPDIAHFYNDLDEEECSDEDYKHAQRVFDKFHCQNMIDYTLLYLRTDVYLLAEAVTNLREMVYSEFKLDICHYLSLPMLSKDLMLKMTGAEIDLISDPEMSNLLQRNIRGGLSYINCRFAAEKDGFAIVYLDANNLYGKAMTYPLPMKDFRWMSKEEMEDMKKNWSDLIHDNEGDGYILEVTLKYPEKLHLSHNSYPLAPEHLTIDEDMLSPYAKDSLRKTTGKTKHRSSKLTATFRTREKYLVHGLNLKLYLEQGLELVEIHRGIKFYQKAFVKPYIELCSKKRAEAVTKSMKDLYKLLCNSLYGKFIENIMKRMECVFNKNQKEALTRNTSPLHQGFQILGESLSVSYQKKPEVKMSQSWAIGFTILELSKYVMQSSFYEHVKPKLKDVSVLMSDTDSWVLQAKQDTPEKLIEALGESFMDCSNYDESHKLFSTHNKAVVGKFKNEVPKTSIRRFVGIRAKSYAFDTHSGEDDTRKCKGIKKSQVRKLTFEDYQKCLSNVDSVEVQQNQLRSFNHENRLIACKKQAFSSFDDKRYLLCGVHSVPYGSRLIADFEKTGVCHFCRRPNLLC